MWALAPAKLDGAWAGPFFQSSTKVPLTPSKSCNDLSGMNCALISQSYRMARSTLS